MSMKQPKILRRMITRFAILLFVAAALMAFFILVLPKIIDYNQFSTFNSAGYLCAIEELPNGAAQAVIIAPDGKITVNPGYKEGISDQTASWDPKGNFVYFISNREKDEPHIFRWALGKSVVERKSIDSRSKSQLAFGVPGADEPSKTALMVSGGTVLEYDPEKATARQVLPPRSKDIARSGGDQGAGGQFDMAYQSLGTSFRKARWTKDKRQIVAVMRRETGEVLIVQDMTSGKPPQPVTYGDRIEFDINPKTGAVVFDVIGYNIPPELLTEEQKAKGKVVRPYHHLVATFDPQDDKATLIQLAKSDSDKYAFKDPVVSPDGTGVAMVVGPYQGNGQVDSEALIVMPIGGHSTEQIRKLIAGDVGGLSWVPDGSGIMFEKTVDKKKTLCVVGKTGVSELTPKGRSFRDASYSPQTK